MKIIKINKNNKIKTIQIKMKKKQNFFIIIIKILNKIYFKLIH